MLFRLFDEYLSTFVAPLYKAWISLVLKYRQKRSMAYTSAIDLFPTNYFSEELSSSFFV